MIGRIEGLPADPRVIDLATWREQGRVSLAPLAASQDDRETA